MSKYFVTCPNCEGNELQEVDYQTFVCDGCGFEFDLQEAEVVSETSA